MPNDAAVTVRIPASLKKRLEARARQGHRSLSAQMLHDLEATAAMAGSAPKRAKVLGRFEGTPVPTDADIRNVRDSLWGKLTKLRNA